MADKIDREWRSGQGCGLAGSPRLQAGPVPVHLPEIVHLH